jgi:hypothetical protein
MTDTAIVHGIPYAGATVQVTTSTGTHQGIVSNTQGGGIFVAAENATYF